MVQFYTLIAVFLVSALSLLGALFLVLSRQTISGVITVSLALSSGVLLGSVFLDLLPESVELVGEPAFFFALFGMVTFFALEKLLSWHHHIEGNHRGEEKPVAYLTLLGDGIHNFVDGVIIAAGFLTSVPLGLMTTIGVVAHEIPHELSDFIILLHGGFSPGKALLLNFLSAATAFLGALAVLFLAEGVVGLERYLVPFAAGNFLYIAASDLIPELLRRRRRVTSLVQLMALGGGIAVIPFIRQFI